jgi:hypothetical protein
MTLPVVDFMVIGAQKSGTTALAHFLGQHPQISMAEPKEPHLFDTGLLDGLWSVAEVNDRYTPFFPAAQPGQLRGEATPIYLYWERIHPLLQRYNPALKLIVLLRDPAERAISHYVMERDRGEESLPLPLALLSEPWRLWRHREDFSPGSRLRVYSYRDRGRYRRQMASLYRCFPRHQVLCLSTDRLWRQHDATLEEVFRFLEVDPAVHVAQEKVFASGVEPGSARWVRKILKWVLAGERRWLARQFEA